MRRESFLHLAAGFSTTFRPWSSLPGARLHSNRPELKLVDFQVDSLGKQLHPLVVVSVNHIAVIE